MRWKKIIINALTIIIAFAMFIAWYEHRFEHKAIPASSMSHNLVYLITMDKSLELWSRLNNGASDMAKMLGVTYKWEAPEQRNTDEQIRIINDAVSAGANALLIAAIDPVKASGAIEDAKARGVKIIYVDSPAYEEGVITLATNNYNAGTVAGKSMISELEAIGINTGALGIIGGSQESLATSDRIKGFRQVIEEDGRFQLLDTKYANADIDLAEAEADAFIKDNTDLVGLFGTNESSTLGIGNAIKESGKKVIGVGFDITKNTQQLINNGYLNVILIQNPYTMGYLGMAQAVAALKGFDTGPDFLDTGVTVKTQFTH